MSGPYLRGLPKESRDKTTVAATVTTEAEPEEPKGRRPSISFYPGVGSHGIPQEGKDGSWKDHPSHRLYQSQGINHNDINIPDTCVWVQSGSGNGSLGRSLLHISISFTTVMLCETLLIDSVYLVPKPSFSRKMRRRLKRRSTPVIKTVLIFACLADGRLTGTPNTMIFTFNKEDHTLGNLLREKLLTNSHVTFAAYRVSQSISRASNSSMLTDSGPSSPLR
jgi:hypothetical protein